MSHDSSAQNILQQDPAVWGNGSADIAARCRAQAFASDSFRPPRDPGAYLTAEDRIALARLKDAIAMRNAAAATMNKAQQALGAAVDEMRRLGFEGSGLDRFSFSGSVFHDVKMPAEIKKAVTFRMEG